MHIGYARVSTLDQDAAAHKIRSFVQLFHRKPHQFDNIKPKLPKYLYDFQQSIEGGGLRHKRISTNPIALRNRIAFHRRWTQ